MRPSILSTWAVAGLLLASLQSVQAQNVKPTLAKVAEAGTIKVAYRESAVPFSYLDNGKPSRCVCVSWTRSKRS
jgi:ABC-type amino acid transport substrate-binding protein